MATKLGELFIEIKAKFRATDRALGRVRKKFNAASLSAKVLDKTVGALSRGMRSAARSVGRFTRSLITLTGPLRMVRFGLQTAGLALSVFSKRFIGASVAMNRFTTLLPFIATGITALGVAVLKLSSDAEEAANLFSVAFGQQAKAVGMWADKHRAALGMGRTQIREYLSTFHLFITSMGATPKIAAEMSQGLTRLTADIASLRNVMPQEAFRRLSAGLAGEIEPLRRLGINVDDVMIKKFALATGVIQKKTQELTQLQKMLIRYNIIVEKTRKDQGDFSKTSTSLKNSIVLTWVAVKDLGETIGNILSPVVTKIIIRLKDWIIVQEKNIQTFLATSDVSGALEKALIAVGSAFLVIKDIAVLAARGMSEFLKQVVAFASQLPVIGQAINIFSGVVRGTTNMRDAFAELNLVVFDLHTAWISFVDDLKQNMITFKAIWEIAFGISGKGDGTKDRGVSGKGDGTKDRGVSGKGDGTKDRGDGVPLDRRNPDDHALGVARARLRDMREKNSRFRAAYGRDFFTSEQINAQEEKVRKLEAKRMGPIGGTGFIPMGAGGFGIPMGAIAGSAFASPPPLAPSLTNILGKVAKHLSGGVPSQIKNAGKIAGRIVGGAGKVLGRILLSGAGKVAGDLMIPGLGLAITAFEGAKIAERLNSIESGEGFGGGELFNFVVSRRAKEAARMRERMALVAKINKMKSTPVPSGGFFDPDILSAAGSGISEAIGTVPVPSFPGLSDKSKEKGRGVFSGMGFRQAFGGLGGRSFGGRVFGGAPSGGGRTITGRIGTSSTPAMKINPLLLGPTPGAGRQGGPMGPPAPSPWGPPRGNDASLTAAETLLEEIRDAITEGGGMGALA